MPPKMPLLLSRLGATSLCLRPALKTPSFGTLPLALVANVSTKAQRRKYRDPYALAQARQRKMANLKRQEELKRERDEALGDPVRGITTPFVESFDDAAASAVVDIEAPDSGVTRTRILNSGSDAPLNHFLQPSELDRSLQRSFILTQPVISTNRDLQDPVREAEEIQHHTEAHERAAAALARIVNLANGNQKDRTRANIQRCIETFGRHNTDTTLSPRAPSSQPQGSDKAPLLEKTPRAGPDTGSSEVQIAILTAKIRVLANQLEQPGGQKDKINKRNLRVLVHKRQKLLAYLRVKERGSERWQKVVETLGLTDGTWKGEISL